MSQNHRKPLTKLPHNAAAAQQADDWNAIHPIGTRVQYWQNATAGIATTTTRSRAWPVAGEAVVLIAAGGQPHPLNDLKPAPTPLGGSE